MHRISMSHIKKENAEVSVLAIIESTLAISLSIWLAWYFETTTHIIIAACIAPLLLLKTKWSIKRGIGHLSILFGKLDELDEGYKTPLISKLYGFVLFCFTISLGFLSCKIISTLEALVTRPISCLGAIPKNWYEMVFVVDSRHPPEVMPGIEDPTNFPTLEHEGDYNIIFIRVNDIIGNLIQAESIYSKFWHLLFALLLFIPALAYRWSIKSSSLIWLPLIWIVNPVKPKSQHLEETVQERIKPIRFGVLSRVTMVFSSIIILLWAVKITLILFWSKYSNAWYERVPEIIDLYIAPIYIYPWHITALLNALLTIGLFIYADQIWLRSKLFDYGKVDLFLNRVMVLKRVLTVFTSLNTLYILWTYTYLLNFLQFRWELPWGGNY